MPLTPRERVLAVLQHEIPDRVLIILGANNATGISTSAFGSSSNIWGSMLRTDIYTIGLSQARSPSIKKCSNASTVTCAASTTAFSPS